MSARKSFPRVKNVDNSKPKLTCSNEPNGPTTDSSNDGGASVTKKKKSGPKSIRRINVQSSKNQNIPSSTDGDNFPLVVTIKQEDTSIDEPSSANVRKDQTNSSMLSIKQCEIKVEKTSLQELNNRGLLQTKGKQPKTPSKPAATSTTLPKSKPGRNAAQKKLYTPISPKSDFPRDTFISSNLNTDSKANKVTHAKNVAKAVNPIKKANSLSSTPKISNESNKKPELKSPSTLNTTSVTCTSESNNGEVEMLSPMTAHSRESLPAPEVFDARSLIASSGAASDRELMQPTEDADKNPMSSPESILRRITLTSSEPTIGKCLSSPLDTFTSVRIPMSSPENTSARVSLSSLDPPLISRVEPMMSSGSSAKKSPMPSAPNSLPPNDLRFMISSKKGVDEQSIDSLDRELDDISEENLESMSIHADDDDLLNDGESVGESLNSLGKHFSALNERNSKEKELLQSPGKAAKHKRKNDDSRERHGKSRRLENTDNKRSKAPGRPHRSSPTRESTSTNQSYAHQPRPGSVSKPLLRKFSDDSLLAVRNHQCFQGPQQRPLFRGMSDPVADSQPPEPKRGLLSDPDFRSAPRARFETPNPPDNAPFNPSIPYPIPAAFPPPPYYTTHVPQRPPVFFGNGMDFTPPVGPLHRPGAPFGYRHRFSNAGDRQRGFEKNGLQEPSRRNSVPFTNRSNNERRLANAAVVEDPAGQDSMKRRQKDLNIALDNSIKCEDFEKCFTICKEIVEEFSKIEEGFLERMLQLFADDEKQTASAKIITFVFDKISIARERTGFKIQDFRFGIKAFLKAEQIDNAIAIVLLMKGKGFKPDKALLRAVKCGVFESTVKDPDNFILFCDELDKQDLITERLVEEALKLMDVQKLKSKTKSEKILSIIKEMKPEMLQMRSKFIPLRPFESLMAKLQPNLLTSSVSVELIIELMKQIETSEDSLAVIAVLGELPTEILKQVGADTWNNFLELSCIGPRENIQAANQVEAFMQKAEASIENRVAFLFVRCLLRNRLGKIAITNLNKLQENDLKESDMTDETCNCLCEILQQSESVDVDNIEFAEAVIRTLIKCNRQPPEDKLLHLLSCLKDASSYAKIQGFLAEMRAFNIQLSYEIYQLAFSALECWEENPDPVIELYSVMKRQYPQQRLLNANAPLRRGSFSSYASTSESIIDANEHTDEVINVDDKSAVFTQPEAATVNPGPATDIGICRYFLHGQVCPQGSKCTFSHMIPAPSLISPFQQALTLTAANLDLAVSSKPNTGLEIGKTDSGYLSNESSQQFFPPVRPPTRSPSIEIARPNAEYEKFHNRMLFALRSEDFHSMYKVYTEMRRKKIEIDDKILLTIYKSFTGEDIIRRFEDLLKLVNTELSGIVAVADRDEDFEQYELLSDADQENLGRLGVRLLCDFIEKQDFTEAYQMLHIFHGGGINYSLFGESFDNIRIADKSPFEITILAVDVCLKQTPPLTDGAMVVLRGVDSGLLAEDKAVFTVDEHLVMSSVLNQLIELLMDEEKLKETFEVLNICKNINIKTDNTIERLNTILLQYSENDELEKAEKLYKLLENMPDDHVLSRQPLMAYLSCLTRAERIVAARHVFFTGQALGTYPTENLSNPYKLDVASNLKRIEMLFVVEQHLLASRAAIVNAENSSLELSAPLVINLFESDGVMDESRTELSRARENMVFVLTQMMNPPLNTQNNGNLPLEILVEPSSILNWHARVHDVSEHRVTLEVKDTRRAIYKEPRTSTTTQESSAKINEETSKSLIATIPKFVCKKVDPYVSTGQVKGKKYQTCCHRLSKMYNKQRASYKETHSLEEIENDVGKFVDKFFQDHGEFQ